MVFLIVGDGLPDVPAVKYCVFALACGEFVLSAARAVGDAGPYICKPEQSDKLKFDRKTCSVLPLFSVPLGQEDCREDDAEAHEHPGRDGFAVDYH